MMCSKNSRNFLNKRGYLEISFSTIFSIIVGIVILSLTIFGVTKLINVEQTTQDAKTGKEIGILLNPLETGFETGKTTSLTLPVETRIYNSCNNLGYFGRQLIKISQKSLNEWTDTDLQVGFSNKYIFSQRYVEGKNFYLFSKPFDFPFKVADLVILSSASQNYCFLDAPDSIKTELSDLKQKNILIDNCSEEDIFVCFKRGSKCNVTVNYNVNYVEKNSEKVYFEGDALMYAAIFADKALYECQLKRLMQRTKQLATLYNDKATFISSTGCMSNLNLAGLSNAADSLTSSLNLASVNILVQEIQDKNDLAECALW